MRITVHVIARSSKNALVLQGEALKVWLNAAPVDGAANEALIRLLAARLHLPRSALRIVRGAGGRQKVLEIEGLTLTDLRDRLA